jgi:hypothetical protein
MEIEEICDQFGEIMRDSDGMIDDLCKQMKTSVNVIFDERNELERYVYKNKINIDDLIETDERYSRYLRGIEVWKRGKKSYEYIKEDIQKYLILPSDLENLEIKTKYMKKIDKELIDVLLYKK